MKQRRKSEAPARVPISVRAVFPNFQSESVPPPTLGSKPPAHLLSSKVRVRLVDSDRETPSPPRAKQREHSTPDLTLSAPTSAPEENKWSQEATGNQNRSDSNRKVAGAGSLSAPTASPRRVCPSANPGGPTGPRGPEDAAPQTELPTSSDAKSKESPPGLTRRNTRPACPIRPLWPPTLAAGPSLPSTQSARRAQPKFPKGRAKLRARGRLPLAASAGSRVRQSKGARSRGMPARRLPASRAAASCGGRRGSGVHAHHRRSHGRPPTAALFPGGWAALGSQDLPSPTRHPRSFLHCARTRV